MWNVNPRLGICVKVINTLHVDHNEALIGKLIAEVAEGLWRVSCSANHTASTATSGGDSKETPKPQYTILIVCQG